MAQQPLPAFTRFLNSSGIALLLSRCMSDLWSFLHLELLHNYRMIFFYSNHFSLIIFYHSVWLGFELFGS